MGFWIIGFLIMVVVGWVMSYKLSDRYTMVGFYGLALISLIMFAVLHIITAELNHGDSFTFEPINSNTVEISDLTDKSVVEGSFFIGTGKVENEMRYYYMERGSLGRTMKSVPVEKSYLVEEANLETPKKETIEYRLQNGFMRWMFGSFVEKEEYVFNIPKGTITTDFIIDME